MSIDKLLVFARKISSEACIFANKLFSTTRIIMVHKNEVNPSFNYDILIDDFIYNKLIKTGIKVISEERFNNCKGEDFYWLVDPIDGSKGLVENDDVTINIALIENGYPVFGVIENLRSKKQYFGMGDSNIYNNVKNSNKIDNSKLRLIISKKHQNHNDKDFIEQNSISQIEKVNSSIKFIYLSNNLSDIYIRNEGSSGWDTAAAQAILESRGGLVYNLNNLRRLNYNNDLRNPPFVATRKGLCVGSYNDNTKEIQIYEIDYSSSWEG